MLIKNSNQARIGFIGWNVFQMNHVSGILSVMRDAYFVVEKRKNYLNHFPDNILDSVGFQLIYVEQDSCSDLDGQFDILVCQTPFKHIHLFYKTKIVMMQYGYAKEVHNFGAWRALAEAVLVYGPYAARKVAPFTKAIIVGNPQYDVKVLSLIKNEEIKREELCHEKTILYAPTWGDLSSLDEYLFAICQLAFEYNILVKVHHNTDLLITSYKVFQEAYPNVYFYGASTNIIELIDKADLVISDYSGAIFDAIYYKKPLVLLEVDIDFEQNSKIDKYSLEYARRAELGLVVDSPLVLNEMIQKAFAYEQALIQRAGAIRDELFVSKSDICNDIARVLRSLSLCKREKREQYQEYIKNSMVELYALKMLLGKRPKNKIRKWIDFISRSWRDVNERYGRRFVNKKEKE